MIKKIQDKIITELQTITEVKMVDVWQGDIEDLIKTPQKMPSLWIIYQGCGFEAKLVIGANIAPHDMTFQIVCINKNLRGAKENSEECYSIIESVREKLIGMDVLTYGYSWPVSEDLIFAGNGILAYGLEYKIGTDYGE